MTTPFNEASPKAKSAIIEAALDPTIVNPVTIARSEELIKELEDSISPAMTFSELRELHAQIMVLRDANRPQRGVPHRQ